MNGLRIAGLTVGIAGALFLTGLVLLPKHLHVDRQIDIDAPVEVVFDHVNDMTKGDSWNPWKANDPTMVWTHGDISVGTGASYSWTSENSGDGVQSIKHSVPNQEVQTHVEFVGMGEGDGKWTFERVDHDNDPNTEDLTRARWQFDSDMGLFGGYVNLFMGPALEADFDDGLQRLKVATEGWEPPAPVVEEIVLVVDTDGDDETEEDDDGEDDDGEDDDGEDDDGEEDDDAEEDDAEGDQ